MLMSYYLNTKTIPVDLPEELLQDISPPVTFTPSEKCCPCCNSELIISKDKSVVVFGCSEVWKGMYH